MRRCRDAKRREENLEEIGDEFPLVEGRVHAGRVVRYPVQQHHRTFRRCLPVSHMKILSLDSTNE